MFKKWIVPLLCLSLALPAEAGYAQGENKEITVSVDHEQVLFTDASPRVNENNHTIVPVRFVVEELGYKVVWNQAKQSIKLSKDGQNLYFRIGQYESAIVDSRTYVPLRYIAEAFGADVQWDAHNHHAMILTKDIIEEPTGPVDESEENDTPSEPIFENEMDKPGWEKKADAVILLAEKYYGVDYLYGAKSGRTDVFDCSSLTQYVFWKNNIKLRRTSRAQFIYDGGDVLSRDQLRRGDLVFFSTAGTARKYKKDDYRRIGHVGIVKEVKDNGEIEFIHTFQKGIGVTDSKMNANHDKGWWNAHFLYGKRMIDDDGTAAKDVSVDPDRISQYIE